MPVQMADAPPSDKPGSRHWTLWLAAILVTGLSLRLMYLAQVYSLPFFDYPVGDSAIYLARAKEIMGGTWLPARPFFYGSMLYPYFLAGVLGSTGGSVVVVYILQVLAGTMTVAISALTARRLYGVRAGIITAALGTLYGPYAFLEADLLGVSWGLLFLAFCMYACIRWSNGLHAPSGATSQYRWLLGASVSMGLAAVERPNLAIIIPLVAAWTGRRASPRSLQTGSIVAVGSLLPLLAVFVLNVAGTGQWVPLTTSTGINLSIGFHSGAQGTFEEPWASGPSEFLAQETELETASIAMASREAGRPLSPMEASSHWTHKAVQFVSNNPQAACYITIRKVLLMLNDVEVANHLHFGFLRSQAPALWLMPIGFGIILILGTVGWASSLIKRESREHTMFLILVGGGIVVSVLPFFVADRYRAPLALPLLIASGAGVRAIVRLIRHGPAERGAAVMLTGALVAGCVAAIPLVRPLVGRDYWMLAQAYEVRGDLAGAIRSYEGAVRAGEEDGALLNNLGLAYRQAGDRSAAVAAFRRAIAVDSTLALPHKNLAMVLIGQGDFAGAMIELLATLRHKPSDAEAIGAVGALLAERGDRKGAAEAFARALALAPKDPRLREMAVHYGIALADTNVAR